MIYTLEKRHEFGFGEMTTYYELIKYERRIGVSGILTNGKTVRKFKTKKDGLKYCGKYNISVEER